MRKLVLLLFFVFALSFGVSAQTGRATPETTLKSFYSWYVSSIVQNNEPLTKQPTKLKTFITLRLYNEIKKIYDKGEYDADYFIDAQDYDDNWAKNIKVSNVTINNSKASANVLLTGKNNFDRKLKVTLIKQKSIWKIDTIKGVE